jgi:bifunctional non-homologous end joining protein LigD
MDGQKRQPNDERVIPDDDGVTAYSRNGANVTRTFPELSSEVPAAVAGRRLVLDGEIVALDAEGRPCFQRLPQRRPQQRRPSPALLHQVP